MHLGRLAAVEKSNLSGIHELRCHLVDLLGSVDDSLNGLLALAWSAGCNLRVTLLRCWSRTLLIIPVEQSVSSIASDRSACWPSRRSSAPCWACKGRHGLLRRIATIFISNAFSFLCSNLEWSGDVSKVVDDSVSEDLLHEVSQFSESILQLSTQSLCFWCVAKTASLEIVELTNHSIDIVAKSEQAVSRIK